MNTTFPLLGLLGLLAVALLLAVMLWRRRLRRRRSLRVVQELDPRLADEWAGPPQDVKGLGDAPVELKPGGVCVYTAGTDPFACLVRCAPRQDR